MHLSAGRPSRSRRVTGAVCCSFASLAILSCGGAPPKEPATAPAPTVTLTAQVAAPPAEDKPPAAPQSIAALVDLVPVDAAAVANLPRPDDALLANLPPQAREALLNAFTSALATRDQAVQNLARDLLASFDGAVLFAGDKGSSGSLDVLKEAWCASARFREPNPIEGLLRDPSFARTDDGRFVIPGAAGKPVAHGVWFAAARVVLICKAARSLEKSVVVASGGAPSFKTSPLLPQRHEGSYWVAADLHSMSEPGGPTFGPGSRFVGVLGGGKDGLGLDLSLAAYGRDYPALGSVIDASAQPTLALLPRGAVTALGLSIQRASGKTLRDVLTELGRADSPGLPELVENGLSQIGLDLGDFDKALGSDAALGVYVDPKYKSSAKDDVAKHGALLFALAGRDDAAQQKVFRAVLEQAKRRPKKLTVKGSTVGVDLGDGQNLTIESRRGFVLLAVGEKKLAAEVLTRFGKEKDTMGASAGFVETRARASNTAHLLSYLDSAALVGVFAPTLPYDAAAQSKLHTMLALTLGPTHQGIEMTISGNGAAALLGTLSGLAVYGVRRYLASAKAAEAKNTIGAISRAAAAAFERETGVPGAPHKLCGSANPVPSLVPKATKYAPSQRAGEDFEAGTASAGWRCLRFTMQTPFYYQYSYRVGGGYKGPSRGGPDPGKDGFEVSAEGDLNGDGKTSLFTRTGKIVRGQVVLSPQVFVADEFE